MDIDMTALRLLERRGVGHPAAVRQHRQVADADIDADPAKAEAFRTAAARRSAQPLITSSVPVPTRVLASASRN